VKDGVNLEQGLGGLEKIFNFETGFG